MSIDNARLHLRMRKMACTDGLTGLFNHRQFRCMFREEMLRTGQQQKALSLIMLDIDDFKKFNDRYGHPNGDKVLIEVARILRDSLRGYDLTFRYGGEEFIAILPECGHEQAAVAAERIRAAVETESRRFLASICDHGVTVSVGVATAPRDGADEDALLLAVDKLLYQAKSCGKNRVYQRPEVQ
jgi:diguanylate cyclase (GGDEF)-like protein